MAKKTKVVRGPQLALPVRGARTRKLGPSKGEPPRTVRVRYVEPPAKQKGNPFLAVRVPREQLAAFVALAKKRKTSTAAMVRAYVSRVTGVRDDGGEDE